MRIITGRARGTRLKTPRGMAVTRPTSDRVKESLFSILGSLVAGRRVLDVFAGTGSLGLEALSRGAAAAVLIDAATAPLLRENVRRCHFEQAAEVLSLDAFAALARLERAGRTFDLVFCDPPYHKGLFERALAFFDGGHLLAENGILVVEHGGDEDALPELAALVRVDGRRYGKTTQLSFFQRRSFVEVDAGE
ncbi:MAG: 16S rRNA (guanine(966)-N(2))-methyltransferase RsmD [Selenomonadaceae bacterium]|uniref:16S rRNA (guanine(966)-N(2))-methyltransferase RsmD n=1 Tax=Selenomonas bovis TaxID=416586 RepID=UPI0004E20A10|nr:16S rRNA (guanine(966)-N(2))-methyltransferase RsmD [Selenomonas bovis]MBQ1622828.1 16S rRNA (guanine(966)-N(2))-methyltransferase RsmD [Selenomonas sp.]MDY6272898.1 16S rRNA (guanine(966)-N(2))-methyltransferase RsmD [Selenomonadaceae bacterium]MDY6299759.1 16S rRNA (guanine(966)-N(2))-methyltransferase RsmD [Selenomonadaceae bacterium]